ncbi:hypothetical protein IZ6_10180 [Terrihabitans soli]|uniref:Uncharacterized protein n=1 Tax=Terrihabitans soli TaxID=708113 RepID=A0A6S6QGL9_9HYPH|nr:hypothetical protein [Terrihabitans soli]BCJ90283.1 hypothetical protein IZ6_10180 [Terrihabitans soli]
MVAFQFWMLDISLDDFRAGNITALLEPQPLEKSAVFAFAAGVGTILVTVYYTALLGRIFRAIRAPSDVYSYE